MASNNNNSNGTVPETHVDPKDPAFATLNPSPQWFLGPKQTSFLLLNFLFQINHTSCHIIGGLNDKSIFSKNFKIN